MQSSIKHPEYIQKTQEAVSNCAPQVGSITGYQISSRGDIPFTRSAYRRVLSVCSQEPLFGEMLAIMTVRACAPTKESRSTCSTAETAASQRRPNCIFSPPPMLLLQLHSKCTQLPRKKVEGSMQQLRCATLISKSLPLHNANSKPYTLQPHCRPTSVSLEPRKGMCPCPLSKARMHSFRASRLLLISAPSRRVCLASNCFIRGCSMVLADDHAYSVCG